jgi:hypothetical protein
MKRHKKYLPYVRRATGRERSGSFRVAFRLAFYQEMGKPYYVLVQRGFTNLAIEVGPTRREVQRSPVPVSAGWKSFRQWAKEIQAYASGKR